MTTRSPRARAPRLAAAPFLVPLLTCAMTALAEPVPVPGTSVSMAPPDGYAVSEAFAGFESPDTGSSITVAELPVEAYAELSTFFGDAAAAGEAFAAQGIEIGDRTEIDVAGEPASMLEGVQRAAGLEVAKYMVLLPGETTVLVTFNVLDDEDTTRDEAIASLESIELGAPASLDEQLAELSFTFEARAPFETSGVLGGSGAALTTFEGTDPTGEKPLVVVTSGLRSVDTSDLPRLAEELVRSTQGFESADVGDGQGVTLGGGEAFALDATAGDALLIQYVWPVAGNRFVRLVAVGAAERLEPLRSTVREIADTVAPRP